MPIAGLNNYYRVEELNVNHDKNGYFLTCKPVHCKNWVLCIGTDRPICSSDLHLTEEELTRLYNGDVLKIPELNCTLQGISTNVFVGNPRYRNNLLKPPSYVQVWCMDDEGRTLFVPDTVLGQYVPVPVEYSSIINGNKLTVRVEETTGYRDADLSYQIGDHLPIPLPKQMLNCQLTLRNTSVIRVLVSSEVQDRYKQIESE